MKLTTIYSLIAAAAAGLGLWSCSADNLGVSEPDNGPALGETVRLTVAVSRDPSAATRTEMSETNGGADLDCKWTEGDKLLVTDASGNVAGLLSLKEGQEIGETAVFDGEVAVATETGKARLNFLYLGTKWSEKATVEKPLGGMTANGSSLTIDYSGEQAGTETGLTAKDLLVKKGEEVTISGTKAYLAKTITMDRLISFGKFKMKGVEATDAYTVSITGSNLHNKVVLDLASMAPAYSKEENTGLNVKADKDGVFYTVLLPTSNDDANDTKLETLTFTANVGEKAYTSTYTSDKDAGIKRSRFYRSHTAASGTTPESFGPIEITMGADTSGSMDDPDLVGPVFTITDTWNKTKTFRFTKANLKYNVNTGEWSFFENQYDFLCQGGTAKSSGQWIGTQCNEIDLFGWGATGLYDPTSEFTARKPEYWKDAQAGTYVKEQHNFYPTSDSKTNQGYQGSYLNHGIQFTSFDWGKAYFLYKNGETISWEHPKPSYDKEENTPLRHFTLSSDDWSKLFAKYYTCGVTIQLDAKTNIYGLLIFGETSKEALKVKLKSISDQIVTKNLPSSGHNFIAGQNNPVLKYTELKLKLDQYKALEKMDEGVVFLPEVGYRIVSSASMSKNTGHYWTATGGQQYTAVIFKFDGDSSPLKLQLDGQSARLTGCAVRLVKEVETAK